MVQVFGGSKLNTFLVDLCDSLILKIKKPLNSIDRNIHVSRIWGLRLGIRLYTSLYLGD